MTYSGYLASTPFFWIFLSGLSAGAALSWPVRLLLRGRHPGERARRRASARTYLWLAGAAALGLAAVFVPGPRHIVDSRLIVLFTATAAVSALGFTFKAAVGLPLLLAAAVLTVAGVYAAAPWKPVYDTEAAARVRVLSVSGGTARLEVALSDAALPEPGDVLFDRIETSSFFMTAELVRYSDYLFFMGRPAGYRVLSLQPVAESTQAESSQAESSQAESTQAESTQAESTQAGGAGTADAGGAVADSGALDFPAPSGRLASVYNYVTQYASYVPGLRIVQVRSNTVRAGLLETYVLEISASGDAVLSVASPGGEENASRSPSIRR